MTAEVPDALRGDLQSAPSGYWQCVDEMFALEHVRCEESLPAQGLATGDFRSCPASYWAAFHQRIWTEHTVKVSKNKYQEQERKIMSTTSHARALRMLGPCGVRSVRRVQNLRLACNELTAKTDLPVISRPTSPEFPSIVRSRASSSCPPLPAPLVPLQASQTHFHKELKTHLATSCPQLPSAETQGQRLSRREQEDRATGERKFLARQFKHSSLQNRRQRSIVQRDFLQRSHDAENIEFLGAKGKDGFRSFLQKKFGSILQGWRAVDSAVGFHGNFKKLWSELDVKQSGTVSLMDVDGEVGKYIRFLAAK
eukprot:Skav210155  [mRNA]  locus=scaffold1811:10308:19279:+ [translate_table: standard]